MTTLVEDEPDVGEEGACATDEVLGREEERVMAEAPWSRPTVPIGGLETNL
jgi:hypothetical protein